MSRMYNSVGAPGEFFPLASVDEVYYWNTREINTSFYFLSSCSDVH